MIAAVLAALVVYASGYVAGALLRSRTEERSSLASGIVQLIAGLFLSSVAFLLSLAVALPWFAGPVAVVVAALAWRGRQALALPRRVAWPARGDVAALAIAAVLVAPPLIACARMAQGSYPPVFFNVDTAYFLEKVHALVHARLLPPPSLSVLGGTFAYHYGVHGIAALIVRTSGLLPHQATFAVVLPLLTIGIVGAAWVAAETLAPAMPRALTVPLLLVIAPTLWHPFMQNIIDAIRAVMATGSAAPLQALARDYETWGIAVVTGQNLATHFLVLAVVAGIAAAAVRRWRQPVFLAGSALLFKAPTGVALAGAFGARQLWVFLRTRRLGALAVLAGLIATFAVVYSAFWMLPRLPPSYQTQVHPWFHLAFLRDGGRLPGFIGDVLWLAVPILAVARFRSGGTRDAGGGVAPFLLMAVVPLIIVNVFRAVDLRPGRGFDFDWFQIVLTVPMLAHAAAVAAAGQAWPTFGMARRTVAAVAFLLVIVPTAGAAAAYAGVLVTTPEAGHEFVDNRAIAAALQSIPVEGSLVVTNDLRYPAEGFSRDNRQMQIPALFGHQAFAVNYAYEAYDFMRERIALQRLLQEPEWSPEIDAAARRFRWTHLLIRKDYRHPREIPLPAVFDNTDYAVYRFVRTDDQ